eukprot:PhF_6_TR10126/c0_g1_i1/m.15738/K02088/CDK3; cyclin-dependent kinase 3
MPQRFEKIEQLGEGTYSVVYKCYDRSECGRIVAVKKIRPFENDPDSGVPCTTLRECSVLLSLPPHPNVVRLYEVVYLPTSHSSATTTTNPSTLLIFEYVPYDLRKVLSTPCDIPTKKFMHQCLSALVHLHSNNVLHRDIKPANLLVDENKQSIKIADFNLARFASGGILGRMSLTDTVVTLWYRAPEVLLGLSSYDGGIDVWSLGCVFWEMAHVTQQCALFPGNYEIDQLWKIFQVVGTPTEGTLVTLPHFQGMFPSWKAQSLDVVAPMLCPRGKDLLARLLQPDPRSRITAAEALAHPYFTA